MASVQAAIANRAKASAYRCSRTAPTRRGVKQIRSSVSRFGAERSALLCRDRDIVWIFRLVTSGLELIIKHVKGV